MTSAAIVKASDDKAAEARAERKKLRDFGLLVGGIFLAWGLLRLYRGKGLAVPMASVGGVLLTLGLILPGVLRLPYRGWMVLGHFLGLINTRILLFLSFFIALVPFGLLRRLFGGSALDAKPRTGPDGQKTYFRVPEPDSRGNKHFENMF